MAWQNPKTNWKAGDVPSSDDFNRIEENARVLKTELETHENDYVKQMAYAVASGTNSYSVSISGITALVEGLSVKIKFQNANTGAATLNINGLGAKQIRKSNGNALSAGNIKAGQICHLVYTGSVFQLLGEGGDYGTAQPEHVLEGYTIGTEEGVKPGTMPNVGLWAQLLTKHHEYVYIPKGYHNGGGVVGVEIENMSADKIKLGEVVGGVVGTLDLKYQHLFLNNFDAEGVDVVLGDIPAYGTKYVDISVPAGIKAVILNNLSVDAYARPPWTGKFDVWSGRVFLKSIQVIDDTTWELKFENEYEDSQACGRFYMHIFYV